MSDWIDLQLSHSLTPVAAPEELWERIHMRKAPRRRPAAVAFAACAAVLLLAVLLSPSAGKPRAASLAELSGSCNACHTL